MKRAKDYWALADRDLSARWPKDSGGQPEKAVRLTHGSELDGSAAVTVSLLESCGIPSFTTGSQGRVVLGFSGHGVEIYVPVSRLEEAEELIEAECLPKEE